MKSPYKAQVFLARREIRGSPDFELTWEANRDDLEAGTSVAYRYYSSGHGAGVLGTTRAAAFFVASLLGPGEEAYIQTLDREGETTGYGDSVRRDDAGRLYTTIGSRFGERLFRGL